MIIILLLYNLLYIIQISIIVYYIKFAHNGKEKPVLWKNPILEKTQGKTRVFSNFLGFLGFFKKSRFLPTLFSLSHISAKYLTCFPFRCALSCHFPPPSRNTYHLDFLEGMFTVSLSKIVMNQVIIFLYIYHFFSLSLLY